MNQDTVPSDMIASVHARLDHGDERMSRIEVELAENTAATKRIEENSADALEFLEAAKGAFKVLNWVGKLAKPIGYILAVVASVIGIWSAIKTGAGIGPK